MSHRQFQHGFSMIEMMIALSLALVVSGAVLGLALSSRRLFDADRSRTAVQHSLRAGRDFVAVDLRQAGERLGEDFPAIEIIDGASGAPDQLVVRRNLLDAVLPLCESLGGSDTSIRVGDASALPPPGCGVPPDDDLDGFPDALEVWRDWRVAVGGTTVGYIYDPVNGNGEFFTVVSEDPTLFDVIVDPSTVWSATYPVANQCRIYVIEQRAYDLNDGLLRVVTNSNAASAVNLVDRVVDFQARAHFSDGSTQSVLGFGDVWRDLGSIEVTLQARDERDGAVIDETQWVEVLPRNVLTR